jgi:hypothetical protein
MTISILNTQKYYMYPMEPPIIQEVSVSPTQLHFAKKRRPDGDKPKSRYSLKNRKMNRQPHNN